MNSRVEGNIIYPDWSVKSYQTKTPELPIDLLGDQDAGGVPVSTGEQFSSEEIKAWNRAVQGPKLSTESPIVVRIDDFRSRKGRSDNQLTPEST